VQRFLAGNSRLSPADILACWFDHKDGRLDRDSKHMYSMKRPFGPASRPGC
jgi:hypothetical protein